MSTGIAGLYGGYASTVQGEADLMARRYNPFLYLATGQGGPVEAYPVEPANGYATGGIAQLATADSSTMPATVQLLQLLQQAAGQQRRQQPGLFDTAGDGGAGPAGGGRNSGNTPASASGANWGPTSQGFDGLSPGRSTGFGLGLSGAGMAIPGANLVSGFGQAMNAGARSAQLADTAAQIAGPLGVQFGTAPATGIAAFAGGALPSALGLGFSDADYGKFAMAHGLSPDEAQAALDNNMATGNVNTASPAANYAGVGIAGLAGPAATGVAQGMGVNPASAMAFGQPGITNMAIGTDGVAAASTNTSDPAAANFGGMASGDQATANSNSEGSQGGNGASGAGGGSGGGSGGGGGSNGGGGDNGGGWARGGRVTHPARFSHGSGLVHGDSGGREDRLRVSVPRGSYVIPADVVSGMGQGNTAAGAKKLNRILPRPGTLRFADGGIVGRIPEVPIQISPGEFVVHPAHVEALGGAPALDQLVTNVRQSNMAVAQTMPGPR